MAESPRTIAIGDVHGCLAAFEKVLELIGPQPDDTLITLGDYIDRGPESRGTIERLLRLQEECRLVPLLGNHDELFLEICDGRMEFYEDWLGFGGKATRKSYGGLVPGGVPATHLDFLRSCRAYYQLRRHFFVHASYLEDVPLEQQPREVLLWESLRDRLPGPHISAKIAVVGHTAQKSGRILDLGYLKCIDTRCYGKGCLTALEIDTGQTWQADKRGRIPQLQ